MAPRPLATPAFTWADVMAHRMQQRHWSNPVVAVIGMSGRSSGRRQVRRLVSDLPWRLATET